MANSEAYENAYAAHNVAQSTFGAAQDAYRARTIGDAAYLAARAEYSAACAAYDAAYSLESDRQAAAGRVARKAGRS